jgi:hypothetical protein
MKSQKYFLIVFLILNSVFINAQIGIGTVTPDVTSVLDISSTSKGLLIPRMTTLQRSAIQNPALGLIIYNLDEKRIENNISSNPLIPSWEVFGKIGLTGLQGPMGLTGGSSTEAGGSSNVSSGINSTVIGGIANSATNENSTVAGGGTNTASGIASVVVGGQTNSASNTYSTVSGGLDNLACGIGSTVAGGISNKACGDYATISGGASNEATVESAIIAGGTSNKASGIKSVVAGGFSNLASGLNAIIGGGSSNIASGISSSVSGGESNVAAGDYSTISGGGFNFAPSFGEWSGGMYGTIYAAASTITSVPSDRIFNVGNGTGLGTRSDALTIFKSGLAILPSVNNTLIANGSDKSIVTKEYLEYKETKIIETTTYTLLQSDCSKILFFTAGAPVTISIAAGLRINSRFEGKQIGDGQLIFLGSGTTINKAATDILKTKGQFSTFSIDWISSETYLLYGNLELAATP